MTPFDLSARHVLRKGFKAMGHEIPNDRIAFVRSTLRSSNTHVHSQSRVCYEHFIQYVVRVADPRDFFSGQRLKERQRPLHAADFEDGEQVR